MSDFIKRWFIYVTPLGQTLPGNSGIIDVVLQTNLDAPFVLKARAIRQQFRPSGAGSLSNVQIEVADADNKFIQNDLCPFFLETTYGGALTPSFGQFPNGVYNPTPIVYPAGSTIWAKVQNLDTNPINNFQMFYLGYQMFRCGQVPDLTYPPKAELNRYAYVLGTFANPVTLPAQMSAPLANVKMNINSDADFVARTLRAFYPTNPGSGATYPSEVFVRLRDWNEKAFSNDLVHQSVFFGLASLVNGLPIARPGLLTPEVWMPANQYIYMDFLRQDGYLVGFGDTVQSENITISFGGSKVYPK